MNTEIKLIETDEGHFYRCPIGILPSVTTILHVIPKPGLEIWKRREPAWQEISENALRVGGLIHEAVNSLLTDDNPNWINILSRGDKEIQNGFGAFVKWKYKSGFEVLSSELPVWSDHRFAGTIDLVGYLDGKLFLIDLKAAKRIYPDYLFQVSAYRHAYEERTGERIEGLAILRLDKAEGFYQFKEYSEEDCNQGLEVFLSLCNFWHALPQVSNGALGHKRINL
ncbi:MAG TPA: hypothetical protein VMW40_03790 [Candidatus Bathyarchaeia archaeon]|nr:hypothetical protein [Candidatus Bathyarchaeia archaeon]